MSGNILRKYRLIHFVASKTGNNRGKLSTTSSKVIELKKSQRGFEPKLYESIVDFYEKNGNSTALPGKRDAKNMKCNMPKLQKRVLNDYLSNLYSNNHLSFSTFARMRPSYYVLVNFIIRSSYLCTQHQNMALKIKILNKDNKDISVHSDIFIKN